jgi:hypothetical protein
MIILTLTDGRGGVGEREKFEVKLLQRSGTKELINLSVQKLFFSTEAPGMYPSQNPQTPC